MDKEKNMSKCTSGAPANACGQRDHAQGTVHHWGWDCNLWAHSSRFDPAHPQKHLVAHARQFGVEAGVWAVWLQFLLCFKDSFISGWMSCYLNTGFAAEKGRTMSGVD